MEASQPEVLIVSDHLAIGRGLELLLREAGFSVTVAPAEPDEGRAELLKGDHDVALVEIRRRAGDGIALAREAMAVRNGPPVVLCTASARPQGSLLAAAGLGAPGLVLLSSAEQTLLDALRAVAAGGRFMDPELAALVAEGSAALRVAQLTPREREVLGLLADGLQGPDIAERLFLSLETVRTHIRNAVGKLGARTRVQAAAIVACAREDEGE
ncbi:MAG TPA: response regulator transcription factor [Solirubrobacteraceae bacterium]|jgi:DNA-binding NarL/FixJ family response regulator|nr:response regulator transcription factor [Solirubrobacteraceae bacterium]